MEHLADEACTILDLHSGGSNVTNNGIIQAASLMPNLKYVDLTGHKVRAKTLRHLATHCPFIEVLRLGRCSANSTEPLSEALLDILPSLEKQAHASLESWDELDPVETASMIVEDVCKNYSVYTGQKYQPASQKCANNAHLLC